MNKVIRLALVGLVFTLLLGSVGSVAIAAPVAISYQVLNQELEEDSFGRRLVECFYDGRQRVRRTIFLFPKEDGEHPYHHWYLAAPLNVSGNLLAFIVGFQQMGSQGYVVFLEPRTGRCRVGRPAPGQQLPVQWGTHSFVVTELHRLAPTKERPVAVLATVADNQDATGDRRSLVFVPSSNVPRSLAAAFTVAQRLSHLNQTLERLMATQGAARRQLVRSLIDHPRRNDRFPSGIDDGYRAIESALVGYQPDHLVQLAATVDRLGVHVFPLIRANLPGQPLRVVEFEFGADGKFRHAACDC